MNDKAIEMIIPTIPKDYGRVKRDLKSFFELLPIERIVFIGPAELEEPVMSDATEAGLTDRVTFMNENDIISFKALYTAMENRIKADGYLIGENSRPGWYYQQFLKLAYANVSGSDYYMSWDSDTIPLRRVAMFDSSGKPYFDTKREYNPGYFKTIKNLFGMEKSYEQSFISEHMLFDARLVREMTEEIEAMDLPGERFYEKIFYAIDIDNMKLGFSEFETYGTWVTVRHPDAYAFREWKSMRRTNLFTDSHDLTRDDIRWLARDYDAASFESYHPLIPDLAELFRNKEYRRNVSAAELYQAVVESGMFGEYVNGMIKEGDLFVSA